MSEAESVKPTRIEVGQRWANEYVVWLVTGIDETRQWPVRARLVEKLRPGGGNRVGYEEWGFAFASFLASREYRYLGPTPSPQMEAPRPAKRQRWRDARGYTDGGKWKSGEPFTLTAQHGSLSGAWHIDGDPSLYFPPESFTDGRLTFVDHGECFHEMPAGTCQICDRPASPPSQPKTAAGVPGNALAPTLKEMQAAIKPSFEVPLTAFQVIQAREHERAAKREADAAAVAAFLDDFDLLPDVSP